MVFAGKSPGVCTQAESRPKSYSEEQAGNIQQYMRHITSMCCRHLFHCTEKPSQQILVYTVPGQWQLGMRQYQGRISRELGQEICSVTATRQPL